MRKAVRLALGIAALLSCGPAASQQVDIGSGSAAQIISKLKPGEYAWAPEVAPAGPMLLIVNLRTQRALLFRNGVPIGASTVSTGRAGRETPTGVFTILQKQVEHYSSKYDDAPMPYMERLTWQGVALHAGHLPGYPASHGCIRLPAGFAKLLYGITSLGMTVIITDRQATPRVAPTPQILAEGANTGSPPTSNDAIEWNPAKSPTGPVSIVVSAADSRALVLRNGIVIGSAPVTIQGPVSGTWAYALRNVDSDGQHWIRMQLSPTSQSAIDVPRSEWQRFRAAESFRRAVGAIVQPGTTVIVTSDSLAAGAAPSLTVIDSEPKRQ